MPDLSKGRCAAAAAAVMLIAGSSGCSDQAETRTPEPAAEVETAAGSKIAENPLRNAYFGDLHVHTTYSFDAFIFGTRATPDDAYRYARGEALTHPAGMTMQMPAPLDFEAVTDHGIYLGMLPAMSDPASSVGQHPAAIAMRVARTPAERRAAFNTLIGYLRGNRDNDDLYDPEVSRAAWAEVVASAERNNDPGRFTAFIGYEFTSSGPAFENLHRNVIYRGSDAPDLPFTARDSLNPEDLWAWMDSERAEGRRVLAIPHNSNGSNGWMFQLTTFDGDPLTEAYAEQRMRNEPLVEVTQVKGTSDTHPALSPNDEWADFEIMPLRIASDLPSQPDGSYVRQAYGNGLRLEASSGFNPFRFGLIGSSDTHNAAGSFQEYNYWSKTGLLDATPRLRGSVPLAEPGEDGDPYAQPAARYWGASGLAGVWAESNTREALFDAMQRKETFATSGPRIRVRFFAGYGLARNIATRADSVAHAYAHGVPMGADLPGRPGESPRFFAWATRAPDSAPLQRLQVIKGWLEDGESMEAVYDVACSDGLQIGADHRCPDNGARVDPATCSYSEAVGAAELSASWQDPDFDPDERAFYYVRVLENPTCRWSTWDAIRSGVAPRPDLHATIQERAWSSPIWHVPAPAAVES